jgi:hypothetical protein
VITHYVLEEWRGEQRISPPGDNFTPRGQNSPLGATSPLGVKFTPRGEVKNGPLLSHFRLSKCDRLVAEYATVGYMAKRIQMRKNRYLNMQKNNESKKADTFVPGNDFIHPRCVHF